MGVLKRSNTDRVGFKEPSVGQQVGEKREQNQEARRSQTQTLQTLHLAVKREHLVTGGGGGCTERQSARLKFISAGDKALTGVYVNDGPMDSSPWRRRNSSLALTGSMWMEMTVRSRAVQRATAGMDNY